VAYLNSNLSAAAVFTEDVGGDAFKDFAERAAAEEHGEFDLIATEMSQRRHVLHRQRRRTATRHPVTINIVTRISCR